MSEPVRILLVSGSTRAGSTNTAALRTACEVAGAGVRAELYDGLADLPHFNPDDDHDAVAPAVEQLRRQIAAADAILFCTPEYAGTLPGSFKNLLDWTVGSTVLSDKPVTWINVAAEGRGLGASAGLATVMGYVGAAVAGDAGAPLPVRREDIGPDGTITDPGFRGRLAEIIQSMARRAGTTET